MKKVTRFVGLDVHKDTIAVAIAEGDKPAEFVRTIGNDEASVRRLVRELAKSGSVTTLKAVYEAGPCGFGLYRLLISMGVQCEVIAPSLIPERPGDRVKTDRRDSLLLARQARAGELTPVRVPSEIEESFRDLVRAREASTKELRRARHRLQKFLLRHDVRGPAKTKAWSTRYMTWLGALTFDDPSLQAVLEDGRVEVAHQQERIARFEAQIERSIVQLDEVMQKTIAALQALRGVKLLTAATIAIEIGSASRFASARQLMSYAGIVPSEYSSGSKQRRGPITKAGNAHLRRVVGEAAWAYARAIRPGAALKKRRAGAPPEVVAIAQKAEKRLGARFHGLVFKGKPRNIAVTAVGREMLGFVWAIAVHVETHTAKTRRAA